MGDAGFPPRTIYFGFGSNLWKHQMAQRCPDSEYIGVARLNKYRWMINSRGYANVVQTDLPNDFVYGLVYTLTPQDERRLDGNENVPYAYTKEDLDTDFWRSEHGEKVDVGTKHEQVKMLVYIDRKRVEDDEPKEEYIYRMNMGIKDAIASGVPRDYIDSVLRKFIPEIQDESIQEKAEQQAQSFEDENLK